MIRGTAKADMVFGGGRAFPLADVVLEAGLGQNKSVCQGCGFAGSAPVGREPKLTGEETMRLGLKLVMFNPFEE